MEINAPLSFFQNELKGFVYKRVKDMSLTEDIVHDVYLKVQSKSDQLRESEKVAGWIYRITSNVIADHFRKKTKGVNPGDLDWDSETPNFNECVAGYLKLLLATLPDKYRIPLELTELEGVSQLALADRLGISYSGAKSRVQRARQMLKEEISKQLILETDAYGNAIVCRSRNCC